MIIIESLRYGNWGEVHPPRPKTTRMEYERVTADTEKRKWERVPFQAPVLLEDGRTGFQYHATICNYSAGGMYVQSKYALRPGRKLRIGVEKLPPEITRPGSLVRITWRERLTSGKPTQLYGMGLQYC